MIYIKGSKDILVPERCCPYCDQKKTIFCVFWHLAFLKPVYGGVKGLYKVVDKKKKQLICKECYTLITSRFGFF